MSAMAQHVSYSVMVPPTSATGIDPSVLAQIAQLSVQVTAAIAAKNWPLAITLGLQIAGLIAAMFAKPVPVPTPTPNLPVGAVP